MVPRVRVKINRRRRLHTWVVFEEEELGVGSAILQITAAATNAAKRRELGYMMHRVAIPRPTVRELYK